MCGPRVSTLHGGHRRVNCWNKHSMQWTGRLTQRHKAAEPARKWRERALSPGPQEQSPKHQGGERTSEPGPWNLRKMEGHQILDSEGAMRLFCPGLQRKMRVDWAQGRGAHTRSWAGKDFFHFLDMGTGLTDEDPGQRSLPVQPTPHQLPDSLLSQLARLL